jgi:hypothetical protein
MISIAGICPTTKTINFLLSFLSDCPTTHAIKTLNLVTRVTPDAVNQYAPGILHTMLATIQEQFSKLGTIEDEDADDETEEAIASNLRAIVGLVRALGRYCAPDELFIVLNGILISERSDLFQEAIAVVDALLQNTTHRAAEALSLVFGPMQSNELTEGFIEIFLEPVIRFVATRSADFVACGMSRAILETCLGHFHEGDAVLSIGSLVGFLVVLEPELAPVALEFAMRFLESSPELSPCKRAFFALVEIAASSSVGLKSAPARCWIERMVSVVGSGLVVRLGHHYLFGYVFVMICALEPSLSGELMPIVSELFGRLNKLKDMEVKDRMEIWSEMSVPSVLSVLTLEWEFGTPYERFDLNEFLEQALSNCQS